MVLVASVGIGGVGVAEEVDEDDLTDPNRGSVARRAEHVLK